MTAIAAVTLITFQSLKAETAFHDLFNGKDLSGWKGGDAIVEEGAIISRNGTTMTEGIYSDYELEFEFRLPSGGNNGIGIHYPGHGDGAHSGMEIQILDNTAPQYANLKDYQYHGSLYFFAAAKKAPLKPVGEWNHQRMVVSGSMIKVAVNDETILEANLDEVASKKPDHSGVKRRSGHIALLGHNSPVGYRNIRIREIAPAPKPLEAGFVEIFDRESLAGWKHHEGIDNWHVRNGILKHTGRPGPTNDLWTEKEFGDFTLTLDWRWSCRGELKMQPHVLPDGSHGDRVEIEELDSGVYVRGSTKSQVNIWNWTVGSGEVYGYRTDGNIPQEIRAKVVPKMKADRPLGEWNHMEIRMQGEVLNVMLNGEHVIIDAPLPGVPQRGPIGLQHHGQALDFANIRIREH